MLPFLSFFDELDLDDQPTQTRPPESRRSRAREGAGALRARFGDRGRGGGRGGRERPRPSGPQLQRLAVLLLALLVILVLGVKYVRSCQRDQEVRSYKGYVGRSNGVVDASNGVARDFRAALVKPNQTRAGLVATLDALVRRQSQIVDNAGDLGGPGPMKSLRPALVEAMQFRQNGLEGLRSSLNSALAVSSGQIPDDRVNAVSAYYTRLIASDAVYHDVYQSRAAEALGRKDIKGVRVDDSTFVPTDMLQFAAPEKMRSLLQPIVGGAPRAGGATGTSDGKKHGTSIDRVDFLPGNQRLTNTSKPPLTLQLGGQGQNQFQVTITNGGDTAEKQIPVQVKIDNKLVGPAPVITFIESGETRKVLVPLTQTPSAEGEHTVVVNVGLVPNETRKENNTVSYKNVAFRLPE